MQCQMTAAENEGVQSLLLNAYVSIVLQRLAAYGDSQARLHMRYQNQEMPMLALSTLVEFLGGIRPRVQAALNSMWLHDDCWAN